MNSDDPAIFVHNNDVLSRGQHFHDEALRLWLLEKGRFSLTSLQALVIMSMEYGSPRHLMGLSAD